MTVDRLLCRLFENRLWGKILDILDTPWNLLPNRYPELLIYRLSPGSLFLSLEDYFCPDGRRLDKEHGIKR